MKPIILLVTIFTTADKIYGGDDPDSKQFGNNMIYNDGDLVVLNDIVIDNENIGSWDDNINLNKFIPPISKSEIICMMHVDRYCTKPMVYIKGLLIKALRDDCKNCSIKEKESVGKIIASMWTHDSENWKLFLTRFDSIHKLERII